MNGARSGTWTPWRKSSYSSDSGNCVEFAVSPGRVKIRDSKDPDGPRLHYGDTPWLDFVAGVRAGEFDLPAGGSAPTAG